MSVLISVWSKTKSRDSDELRDWDFILQVVGRIYFQLRVLNATSPPTTVASLFIFALYVCHVFFICVKSVVTK